MTGGTDEPGGIGISRSVGGSTDGPSGMIPGPPTVGTGGRPTRGLVPRTMISGSRSGLNELGIYPRFFFRIRRSFAMWRFAAALPLTRRAGLRFRAVEVRRVVRVLRRRVGRFFATFLRRRLRVGRFGASKACTAGVCCAKPANPPGGMSGCFLTGILSPQ